jgi:excisionase family DNA binding protein
MQDSLGPEAVTLTGRRAVSLAGLPQRPQRALYKVSEVVVILNLSRSQIYELIRNGRLRTVTEGRSRLIPARAIDEYVELLLGEAG